ncbi:MAG: hypothetical protein RLY50_1210 [Actinomycetota bacterium]
MSDRERDLARVSALRNAREAAVAEAASGQLEMVLGLPAGDDRTETYVVKLLDVTPGVGKVAGRRMLASLGIAESVRVSELSGHDRSRVLTGAAELAKASR